MEAHLFLIAVCGGSPPSLDPFLICSLLPDGHFDVPTLSKVMSQQIIEPSLPKQVVLPKEDPIHSQAAVEPDFNLDLHHIEHDISRLKAFLRSLLMHAAVGTTLGGICTIVGEPQNLIVAERMNWDFGTFVLRMLPVWATCLPCGIATCIYCEQYGRFGYGAKMPKDVRKVLQDFALKEFGKMRMLQKMALYVQIAAAIILIISLVTQVATVSASQCRLNHEWLSCVPHAFRLSAAYWCRRWASSD